MGLIVAAAQDADGAMEMRFVMAAVQDEDGPVEMGLIVAAVQDGDGAMEMRFVVAVGKTFCKALWPCVCMTIMLSGMICCSELCKDLFAAQMVYEIQEVKGMDLNDSGKLLNSERAISQVKYVHDIGH